MAYNKQQREKKPGSHHSQKVIMRLFNRSLSVKTTWIYIFILLPVICFAQKTKEGREWLPVFENNLPSKVASVKSNINLQYSINSTSGIKEIGDGSTEVSRNRNLDLNLRFPILNKPDIKLTGGVKYTDEEFIFEDQATTSYPLYVSLNDRNLKSLGGNIKGLFHLSGNRSFLIRTGMHLAGDFYRNESNFSFFKLLKFSLAAGYGIKKDSHTFYAVGVYYSYTFGRPSLYPAVVYSKRFNNGFALETLLPKGITAWKNFSDKTFIYVKTNVEGASYRIRLNNSILESFNSLELRQSYLTFSAGITQRLAKWVWMEGEFGYSHNLNFNVSESDFVENRRFPRPNKEYLIKSDVSGSPFISLSLFISPPKDFIKKHIK